jgi:lipopolysaccharide transport system ATP-binding protein
MRGAIETRGLWEGFRTKSKRGYRTSETRWALRDITLSVPAGEKLGVVGGNGSGKTTLLQCMAGVLRPMRGEVIAGGHVGALIDHSSGFHRELTGRENLTVALALEGISKKRAERLQDEIMEFAGLDAETLAAPIFTYSAGMILRLGFSILVHAEPDVMVVDEVLAVGDAAFQSTCLTTLRESAEAGRAVVLVSHDLDLIRDECDRVAVLDAGRLLTVDRPSPALELYLREVGPSQAPPVALHPLAGARAGRRRRA